MARIRITKQQGREWAKRPPSVKPSQYVKQAIIKPGVRAFPVARVSDRHYSDHLSDQEEAIRDAIEAAGGAVATPPEPFRRVGPTCGREHVAWLRNIAEYATSHNCIPIAETSDRWCRNFHYDCTGEGEDAISDRESKALRPGKDELTFFTNATSGVQFYTLHDPDLPNNKASAVRIRRGKLKKRRKTKRRKYKTGQRELLMPKIIELHEAGISKKEIARRLGTDRRNVIRWLKSQQ